MATKPQIAVEWMNRCAVLISDCLHVKSFAMHAPWPDKAASAHVSVYGMDTVACRNARRYGVTRSSECPPLGAVSRLVSRTRREDHGRRTGRFRVGSNQHCTLWLRLSWVVALPS